MKKFLVLLFIALITLSSFGGTTIAATLLTLSKTEIQHGEFFDITGAEFGSTASEYNYVCFGSTTACARGTDIATRSGFEWTNTRIRMALPSSGIPISGEIIVLAESQRQSCTDGVCQTVRFSAEKGRAQYTVKPSVSQTVPAGIAKPGDQVRITGTGFGDFGGAVLFDGTAGSISSWSYNSIDVRTPSPLTKQTGTIIVKSSNGKESTPFSFIVGIPISQDELSFQQYYLSQINIPSLWSVPATHETLVAVLDDGVYHNHPDLQSKMWRNTDEIAGNSIDDDKNGFIDDHLGYNFWDKTAAVDPKGGHGTAVAGVIAAAKDNTIGIAGIASRVKIMPIIISDGKAVSFQAIKDGVRYAVENGAEVINISASSVGASGYIEELTELFQWAFIRGAVLVISAGNRDVPGGIGQNLNLIPESPVCNNGKHRILLGVAALNNPDSTSSGRTKAIFSSYGSNCVNVAAPGVDIASTVPPLFQRERKFYDSLDGTSFSAPVVSGVAAALKSIRPDFTNYEIINRIIAASENIDSFNPGFEGQIGGRVNTKEMLSDVLGAPRSITFETSGVRAGESIRIRIDHYLESFTLRIADERSLDAAIPKSSIKVLAADRLEIAVPRTIPPGTYRIRVLGPFGELFVSSQTFTILESSGAVAPQPQPSPVIPPPAPTPSPTLVLPPPPPLAASFAKDEALITRLLGTILLQVEKAGEAWYVYPRTRTRYYLGRPDDAFSIMRRLGLGAKHDFIVSTIFYPTRLLGSILIDVESHGEAYYIYPKDRRAYYLGRPADAFLIMRSLGLGITDKDLAGIPITD